MKLGLALPHYDFSFPGVRRIQWPLLRDWAQRAEEMGFDSLWLSDHLFFDLSRYGGSSEPQFSMECFTSLSALSQWTRRARLGSLVACSDLRHPSLLGKVGATLSAFSDGRFDLGIGAGWYEPEFLAAGVPFDNAATRVERLAEAVQVVRGMASNPSFSFEGRYCRVKDVWTLPQPRSMRVFVGGKRDSVVRTAGQHADGYNTAWAETPSGYARKIGLLNRAAEQAGRAPANLSKSVGLLCLPGRDEAEVQMRWERYLAAGPSGAGGRLTLAAWRENKLAGTPAEIGAKVQEFSDSGAEEVILSFGLVPFQISDASAVEDFVAEFRPQIDSIR